MQWQGWKYADGDLCPRDGAATRARTVWTPELGQHARMARGVLKTAATGSRTAWTPDVGQVAGTGRDFLVTARPPGEDVRARSGSWPGGGVDHGRTFF